MVSSTGSTVSMCVATWVLTDLISLRSTTYICLGFTILEDVLLEVMIVLGTCRIQLKLNGNEGNYADLN